MAKKQIEATIRDWLAHNLSFIEKGLSLIDIEYHLPDSIGSRGYIDILAKDTLKNFVIIEIKRANSSARQTMTEILKYHALIKQKFKAKDSEIRIIIVSTHWKEILRAFSELVHRTTYAIKGFEITIDPTTSIPQTIEEQVALSDIILERKLSRIYSLDLFFSKEKRKAFRDKSISILDGIGVTNYIFIDLDYIRNQSIMYPYVSFLIFQQQSDDSLLDAITKLTKEEYETDIEFDSESEYNNHLQEVLICALYELVEHDSCEVGYPEKLDAELNTHNWEIKDVNRHGVFKEDPRYDDELLIQEVRGLTGNNINRYISIGESTQKEKILEIIKNSQYCLDNATPWLLCTRIRLEQILQNKEKVRVGVFIYNPKATLEYVAYAFLKNDLRYLPAYQLIITFIDQPLIEIYTGKLSWNGKHNTFSLLSKDNDIFSSFMNIHWGLDSEYQINASNLFFSLTKTIFKGHESEHQSLITIDDSESAFILDKRVCKSLGEWKEESPNVLLELLHIYKTSTNL